MDEGQLRAFLMICDYHSITRAADEIGIAQPSLSQLLLRLEDELGAKLFDRTSRGVTMTSAGRAFRAHADSILKSTRRAREDVCRSVKGVVGDLAFGLPVSLGELMGPTIIRRTREELPGVRLRLRFCFASDLAHWLEEGLLNGALLYYSNDLSYLPTEHVANEELYLIGPPDKFGEVDKRGIAVDPIDSDYLRDLDLVLPPVSKGLSRRINQQPHGEAIRLSVRGEVDSLPVLKTMLLTGAGYSLLPYIAVRNELLTGQLSAARVRGMGLTLPLSLVRAGTRPPEALDAIEQIVRDTLEMVQSSGDWLVEESGGRQYDDVRSIAGELSQLDFK